MKKFDKLTQTLIITAAEQLIQRVKNKNNVSIRTAIFNDITKKGKKIQLQFIATDVDFLDDFKTEIVKHCDSVKV